MSRFVDLHGWKLVTLLSALLLSCSIAFAAWMLAPPRYGFERVKSGSSERIYRTDRMTGTTTYAGPSFRPLTYAEEAKWELERRKKAKIRPVSELRDDELKRAAAGEDPNWFHKDIQWDELPNAARQE